MTKHVEKVDEVKKEVNFFNNYLRVRPIFLPANIYMITLTSG